VSRSRPARPWHDGAVEDHNRRWWDERARLHPGTPFYAELVERLRAGGDTLTAIEKGGLGDVAGKALLHVQCHIGTDTLSWARRGARVTGLDFSPPALQAAVALAAELGLEARWVESDALGIPARLHGRFDVVFASWGVITWIGDLDRWFDNAAACLRPGGTLFLAEIHPVLACFDAAPEGAPHPVDWVWPYFHPGAPLRWEEAGSYADRDAETRQNVTVEHPHSLSDVLGGALRAGLRVDRFDEHRALPYRPLPIAVRGDDGLYRLPPPWGERIPLSFSLRATRE